MVILILVELFNAKFSLFLFFSIALYIVRFLAVRLPFIALHLFLSYFLVFFGSLWSIFYV